MSATSPYWTEDAHDAPLPPLAPGLPLLGSVAGLAGDALPFFGALYARLGPIFRLHVLGRHFTVIAGPQANLFMAAADGELLGSHKVWGPFAAEWHAPHLLLAQNGPAHAALRGVQKPGFARGRILDRLPETVSIVHEHLAPLRPGQSFALVPLMQRIVTDQLGAVMIGRRPGTAVDDIRTAVRASLNALVAQRWPSVLLWSPGYRRAKRRMLALAQAMVAERRARSAPQARPDLIDDLLAEYANGSLGLTEGDLLIGVLGPYVAGLDTVANTLSFLLWQLVRHPEIMAAAVAEIDAGFDPSAPTAEQLKSLGVLHGAAMETLRMYPVAGVNARTAARSFTFMGYSVPGGTNVLLAGGVAHYLESLYPHPNDFDIARYQPPRNEHRVRGAFAPFGSGPHTCLGAGLADVQIAVTAATILSQLALEAEPDARPRLRIDPTLTLGRHYKLRVAGRRT